MPSAVLSLPGASARWLLAALVLLGACGPGGGDGGGRPRVGVSLLTQEHAFYKDLERGLREGADERGLELIIQSAQLDPARQTTEVENFITRGVDAIVICPVDSAGVVPSIERANSAGIPVFTADIAADAGAVVCHVASDNVQGGRLAAGRMAELLGGQGTVLIIDQPEVRSVQDRVQGFLEGLAEHPGLVVVDRPSGGGLRDKSLAVAEAALQAHPDLDGIFGINDDTALGALRAVGDRDVVIIGYDATPEAREAIARGTALKADVAQSPERIGRITAEMIADHLGGESVPATVPVEVGLVDQASLARDG